MAPYSCGVLYIRETDRSINKRIQEHTADISHCETHTYLFRGIQGRF